MDLFFLFSKHRTLRKDSSFLPAFFWISGLLSGLFVSVYAGTSSVSMMSKAVRSSVSIVALLSTVFVPLLLSAFSAYWNAPQFLLPVIYLKAFLFSYCGYGVLTSFGSAGWLVCLLFLFSDSCMLPVYWMFWLYISQFRRDGLIYRLLPVTSAAFLIASIDCTVISPFLAELLSF